MTAPVPQFGDAHPFFGPGTVRLDNIEAESCGATASKVIVTYRFVVDSIDEGDRVTRRAYTLAPRADLFWWIVWALCAVVFAMAYSGYAQPMPTTAPTTRPGTIPVLVWRQPVRNIPMLVKMGVRVFVGPEVENSKNLTPEQLAAGEAVWFKAIADNGVNCIVLNPKGPLPSTAIGILHENDEPNGKLIPPSVVQARADFYRQQYPGVPLSLSMAGDKITSANFSKPEQLQLYRDYAKATDNFTVDAYSRNRNASRYPLTWTADAARLLMAVTGKPVYAWIEVNDQQIRPVVATDPQSAPSPDDIEAEVNAALDAGVAGIGWFATSDLGRYGWPQSFWPAVDRNGASMQPQYDAVRRISLRLTGRTPATQPTSQPSTKPTTQPAKSPDLAALEGRVAELKALVAGQQSWIDGVRRAATQPSGGN